jgi:leucyl aminopeptidase
MNRSGTVIEFSTAKAATQKAVLIVPLNTKPEPAMELVAHVDKLCDDAVSEMIDSGALQDDVGALAHSTRSGRFRRILAVSLGDHGTGEARHIRSAAAQATRWLISQGIESAVLWLDGLASCGVDNASYEWAGAMTVAGYRFEQLKKPDPKAPAKLKVTLQSHRSQLATRELPAMKEAIKLGLGVNYTRQLAMQPGNLINPKTLAAEAKRLATEHKLKYTLIDQAKAKQLKMGGLIGVGQGAEHKGCLIRLEYKGAPRARQHTVFVGKAITFDTGGYNLKPTTGIGSMKYDKTGGCTVMGIIKTAALLKLKCNITALIATAENMVSDEAYRPGDILTMANGKTVEITNTDAEGRMVLADALWYAQKHCKPTAVIDLATLTGGVVITFGSVCAGLMGNDDNLLAEIEECGRRTHERVWRLPLWDDFRDLMKGTDSDLVNSSSKRDAHCIQGGIFLKEFVEDDTPWAHVDIAGTATSDNGGKSASGYGVRLFIDYLSRQSHG